eukprot:TRINITY_DN8476_c1_g1_i2.p2 TRINITY_DN8476_c1_g1~~TRINITY_DN8476_c1_g1_i2.p2  ORF type:complete len:152 (+),score=7.50 TRINITY_DN8476_c1_g1_i2:430-885(+)
MTFFSKFMDFQGWAEIFQGFSECLMLYQCVFFARGFVVKFYTRNFLKVKKVVIFVNLWIFRVGPRFFSTCFQVNVQCCISVFILGGDLFKIFQVKLFKNQKTSLFSQVDINCMKGTNLTFQVFTQNDSQSGVEMFRKFVQVGQRKSRIGFV